MKFSLTLEWLKWRHHKSFQFLVAVYLVLLPASVLVVEHWSALPSPLDVAEAVLIFPNVWQYLGFIANWLACFSLGIFAVLSITTEFHQRTIRQNIIMGLSRKEFYGAKLLFMLAIASFGTLYYGAWALVIGYRHTEIPLMGKILEQSHYLGLVHLATVGYMSLGTLAGLLVRRTGLAVVLYLSYVSVIEIWVRWGLHFPLIANKSIHFYPVKAFSDLAPFPVIELAAEFEKRYNFGLTLDTAEAIMASLAYVSIFNILIYNVLKNKDL